MSRTALYNTIKTPNLALLGYAHSDYAYNYTRTKDFSVLSIYRIPLQVGTLRRTMETPRQTTRQTTQASPITTAPAVRERWAWPRTTVTVEWAWHTTAILEVNHITEHQCYKCTVINLLCIYPCPSLYLTPWR